MSLPDVINSGFALGGGVAMLINCRTLYRDKSVRGTSILSGCFFMTWAAWNVFFFTHLEQWVSVCTTVIEVGSMVAWVSMAVYYTRRERLWGRALRETYAELGLPQSAIGDHVPQLTESQYDELIKSGERD